MLVLALDLSTKTGFALLRKEGESCLLLESGSWALGSTIESHGEYPLGFILAAEKVGAMALELVERLNPDVVVIEESNPGGRAGRYTQKFIEIMHCCVVKALMPDLVGLIRYVTTSEWRGRTLGLSVASTKKTAKPLLKEYDLLKKQFDAAPKKSPERKDLEQKLKTMRNDLINRCIWHKVDKKSISVAFVNLTYGKNLAKGQNDEADAICLGTAFIRGAAVQTNEVIFNKKGSQ